MTVYADILIFLNIITDYFMLRITDLVLKRGARFKRTVLSAVLGGIFSLYIFLPQSHFIIELFVKILMCGVLTLLCFGFKNVRAFVRTCAVFTAVNYAYGGICIAVWYLLKPKNLIINNSVVYFGISPVLLIVSATVFYLLSLMVRHFFGRKNPNALRCNVNVILNGKSIDMSGIIDTGNALSDPFGESEVIIADEKYIKEIFKDSLCESRYRIIPCKTVSGSALLDAYRVDLATVNGGGKTVRLKSPVIALSKEKISEAEAIINPKIFD